MLGSVFVFGDVRSSSLLEGGQKGARSILRVARPHGLDGPGPVSGHARDRTSGCEACRKRGRKQVRKTS